MNARAVRGGENDDCKLKFIIHLTTYRQLRIYRANYRSAEQLRDIRMLSRIINETTQFNLLKNDLN